MAEKLAQVELDSIRLLETNPRSLSKPNRALLQEDDVETGSGLIHVAVQGDRHKPAMLTYHDIGLNSSTCFDGFFNHEDMHLILHHFCVYHVNAPGQQDGSLPLPQGIGFTGDASKIQNYTYPSMEQLSDMLNAVIQFYGLHKFIGFGSGAGANILSRYAIQNPDKVEALVLLNGTASKAGWTEWGYQKVNVWHLRNGNLSNTVEEYLLWHWLGEKTMETNRDLTVACSAHLKSINPINLGHFMDSFAKRSDLGLQRDAGYKKTSNAQHITCPVLLVSGDYSPHIDDTVDMNSRMDPATCSWMKFECGGLIMEEAPEKLAESLRLFLQGIGYVTSVSQTRIVQEKASNTRLHNTPLQQDAKQPVLC